MRAHNKKFKTTRKIEKMTPSLPHVRMKKAAGWDSCTNENCTWYAWYTWYISTWYIIVHSVLVYPPPPVQVSKMVVWNQFFFFGYPCVFFFFPSHLLSSPFFCFLWYQQYRVVIERSINKVCLHWRPALFRQIQWLRQSTLTYTWQW